MSSTLSRSSAVWLTSTTLALGEGEWVGGAGHMTITRCSSLVSPGLLGPARRQPSSRSVATPHSTVHHTHIRHHYIIKDHSSKYEGTALVIKPESLSRGGEHMGGKCGQSALLPPAGVCESPMLGSPGHCRGDGGTWGVAFPREGHVRSVVCHQLTWQLHVAIHTQGWGSHLHRDGVAIYTGMG